jgi:hypothetical protein
MKFKPVEGNPYFVTKKIVIAVEVEIEVREGCNAKKSERRLIKELLAPGRLELDTFGGGPHDTYIYRTTGKKAVIDHDFSS